MRIPAASTITAESASEIDGSRPVRNMGRRSENRTIPGAVRELFRGVGKAIARRAEDDPPPPRRRGGGDTRTLFPAAARKIMRRTARVPGQAYAAASAYLADTLDWLNLWGDELDSDAELKGDIDAKKHLSPHV
jgi:hypothetical protein